ncbi:MAG: hypothetical protein EOP06_08525 [Proteobacteria bacterium]|nr:MAG: hypothetical protein EOP06_08525 [Pseudomonadota bacterium]
MDRRTVLDQIRSRIPTNIWPSYESVLNRIALYNGINLFQRIMQKIDEVDSAEAKDGYGGWLPWDLLTFFKWTLAIGNFRPENRNFISDDSFRTLFSDIKDLPTSVSIDLQQSNPGSVSRFMRITAFQQFWLQRSHCGPSVARQYFLFFQFSEPQKYDFAQRFRVHFGVELKHFLELTFILTGLLVEDRLRIFSPQWFDSIAHNYPEGTIDQFLKIISCDLFEAANISSVALLETPLHAQITEQSPFTRKPVFRTGNQFKPFTKALLSNFICYGLYDIFKAADGALFSPAFGTLMEKYIAYSLDHIKSEYIPESQQQRILGRGISTVDFIIPLGPFTLLVESKAIELNARSRIDPSPGILYGALKNSAIKAVEQCFFAADRIKSGTIKIESGQRFICLIVTYKELFLGRTQDSWPQLMAEHMEKYLCENKLSPELIDPEDIYFISIDEWDLLQEWRRKKSPQEVADFFNDVALKNSQPATAKFSLGMHLAEAGAETHLPEYLQLPLDDFFGTMRKKIRT